MTTALVPPDTIPVSSIILGERISRQYGGYKNLEELAEEIRENGLIEPIVLAPIGDGTYKVVAGGRRFRAATEFLGVTEFYHGISCVPSRIGYLIGSELAGDRLKQLIIELAENLHRDDMDWRDELELLVTAWRLARNSAWKEGTSILMRQFGTTLGVSYTHLQAADIIYDDFIANPERYAQCVSIRNAYATVFKAAQNELLKVVAEVSLRDVAPSPNEAQFEPIEGEAPDAQAAIPPVHISLSSAFHNVSGIDFMETAEPESVDHVITDPDYAVDTDVLLSNMVNAAAGVAQASVADSLADLRRLIPAAYRILKSNGFFVFFYDLDHHEKLAGMCKQAGFAVQRWPIIWHKVDYRSNAAPAYNFCKNIEYAMVCRKANATLLSPQLSSIFACPTGTITRDLGHPFAKPYALWRFIYKAVASPGQTVFDPCVGSGSAAIAAAQLQLRPSGCEINPDHYAKLIVNLQTAYADILKRPIRFS